MPTGKDEKGTADAPVDRYHVVVTQHGLSWAWELYRNGEPLPARLRDGFHTSKSAAAAARRAAIRAFLAASTESKMGYVADEVAASGLSRYRKTTIKIYL
jgi:hypothetical protein